MAPPQPRPLLPRGAIEVIDSRTTHLVKVACMSCIRGHRTTACGKASCRPKVYWTVKRPGRPSNACTCPRLGPAGQCQCNIATSGCTHRAKKGGESRSVDCRCDEDGRRCCILESNHWAALVNGQTPRIVFYDSPEELSHARMPPANPTISSAPSFPAGTPESTSSLPNTPGPMFGMPPANTGVSSLGSYQSANTPGPMLGMPPANTGVSPLGSYQSVGAPANTGLSATPTFPASTPQSTSSLPSTPGPVLGLRPANTGASPLGSYQSAPYETPRFGFMGVGSPMGGEGYVGHDTLQWQGQAPQAPLQSNAAFLQPQSGGSPNQTLPTNVQSTAPSHVNAAQQQYHPFDFTPVSQTLQDMTIQPQASLLETPAQIQREQWMEDYYNYQFPGAICQNCGLHGCNCRSCPAVMQNSLDGSWATCCSRKHVRNAEIAALGLNQSSVALEHQNMPQLHPQAGSVLDNQAQSYSILGLKPGGDQPFSPSFTMDESGLESAANPNLNDFLMTDPDLDDLDLPSHGCCCGGDT